jgi:hypothetical protein
LRPASLSAVLSAVCDQVETVKRVAALNLNATLLTKPLMMPCLLSAINEALADCEKAVIG